MKTNKDLIDRALVIKAIDEYERLSMVSQTVRNMTSLREVIKWLPAVPEIRCKDCKWCEDADGSMCKNPASWVVATDRDFGCVLAERREHGSD